MAAPDFKPRHKPVTYGKKSSNKPLPIFNVHDSELDDGVKELARHSEKPSVSGMEHHLHKRSRSAQPNRTTNGDGYSGERSPVSSNSSTQGKSDHLQTESANSSVFDLVSSDEDMDQTIEAHRTRKRRKLTPVQRSNNQVRRLGRKGNAVPRSQGNRAEDIATAQSAETVSIFSDSDRSRANSTALPRSAVTSKPRKRATAPRRNATNKVSIDLVDKEAEMQIVSMTSSPTPPHTPVGKSPEALRSNSSSPSAQLIDQLNRSIPFQSRLNKRVKRTAGQPCGSGETPSPSRLAMATLRLTPEEVVRTKAVDEGHEITVGLRPLTPSRSRRRLIDALDSPQIQSTTQQFHDESPRSTPESSISGETNISQSVSHNMSRPNNHLTEKGDDPPAKQVPTLPVGGPKVTYAKQRSHLSDMVFEDLSDLAVPSITHLVEPASPVKPSANLAFGWQRSQRSQEELKDQEDATGGAIRSIHELRQAGENSRFQGNLDSIFEDLEATGRTGRSRRLRALMALTDKFLEPSFCLRFVESGMHQRFAGHAMKEADILGSTLTGCAISILLSSCKPSVKVVQQVFDAVMHSSTPLLAETKELSTLVKAIARDRKQNLSGAMCKDVIQYQQTVLASQMWTIPKPTYITPQLIALRSVEIAIRGLRELKDFETALPLQVFEQLVAIVEDVASSETIELAAHESVLILESTVSVLELAAQCNELVEYGHDKAAKRFGVLGPLLAKADILPRERQDKIGQLVLRLIISFTNNNKVLCESLGQTGLVPAISTIVKKNFLDLAEHADRGQPLDEQKLESVILALGSLINFAECSQSSRLAMNVTPSTDESFVAWLVAAFTRRAGKAAEASSLEQTHALVTFGYLSMLICTLCLDDGIRNTVRASMTSRSLHPLILTVEEFLNHFRTVEQVMMEDEAPNNFTDRFGGIVRELREAEEMV